MFHAVAILRRYIVVASLFAFVALLSSCMPSRGPAAATVAASFKSAKPLSDAEQEKFLIAHQRAGAVGASAHAMGVVAGLDPTGLGRMVADAQVRRTQDELQKQVPSAVAYAYAESEEFCRQNSRVPECADFTRLRAQSARDKSR